MGRVAMMIVSLSTAACGALGTDVAPEGMQGAAAGAPGEPPSSGAGSTACDEEAGGCAKWYRDCDGDGYAAAGASTVVACSMPAPEGSCGWTMRVPAASAADCNDSNADYHPGADFGIADTSGNGDLNCDLNVEKKWEIDDDELRLDSFLGANGEFKLCDLRNGPRIDYPQSLADFATRGQCPCWVEWIGDAPSGHLKWTSSEVACSTSTTDEVIPSIWIRKLDATCTPSGDLYPGVQRCR